MTSPAMRQTSPARLPSQLAVALVGFQGRGCAEGVQPDFGHALLLRSPSCSIALKMRSHARTTLAHRTPDSNTSARPMGAGCRGPRLRGLPGPGSWCPRDRAPGLLPRRARRGQGRQTTRAGPPTRSPPRASRGRGRHHPLGRLQGERTPGSQDASKERHEFFQALEVDGLAREDMLGPAVQRFACERRSPPATARRRPTGEQAAPPGRVSSSRGLRESSQAPCLP